MLRGARATGRAARSPRALPEQTWESSHLGGDRFAATMIVLPHGLYYGRVSPTDAVTVVDRYLQGEIVEEFYRGRSSLSNVAQAAQSFARAATADARIGALAPLREERTGEGTWTVDLASGDARRHGRTARDAFGPAAEHVRGDAGGIRA